MSKRTRLRKRWQIKQGDFELKRAKFNDKEWKNDSITFEVWYKGELIGKCGGNQFYSSAIIYSCENSLLNIGNVKFRNTKNQLPSDIEEITILPSGLNWVFEKYVLFEKKGNWKRVFVSPGVYTKEND